MAPLSVPFFLVSPLSLQRKRHPKPRTPLCNSSIHLTTLITHHPQTPRPRNRRHHRRRPLPPPLPHRGRRIHHRPRLHRPLRHRPRNHLPHRRGRPPLPPPHRQRGRL